MDTKAQRRLNILTAVVGDRISVPEAATALGVSERHVRRLLRRFESDGASALVHGNRGRSPANRLSKPFVEEILGLVEAEYEGFNDVHLKEALERDHDLRIGRETLRGLLRAAGRKPKRKRRPPKHRSRRKRRSRRGAMVQWDGSLEHWFGPDQPKCELMAAVDDATGELVGGALHTLGVWLRLPADTG